MPTRSVHGYHRPRDAQPHGWLGSGQQPAALAAAVGLAASPTIWRRRRAVISERICLHALLRFGSAEHGTVAIAKANRATRGVPVVEQTADGPEEAEREDPHGVAGAGRAERPLRPPCHTGDAARGRRLSVLLL
eukprot:CAMPEP_0179983204 /NCGR_PEP_ID=MMETSP0984-20121128/415_1 /TAXON_ID=483367 /ORGANISM="non described non described, Strain CCMP 2436" /LENGTH=133 /DNA_ID=CAMNT_0021901589 /DNA_START=269 /DNA_END=666 /DNA_ORIENTATION=+